jgi:hypothetical protein
MWAYWTNLFLGAWLLIAPFVLGYEEIMARFNDAAVGLAIAVFALLAASFRALRFVHVALGGWLLLAPLVLGYGHSALPTANDIIVGVLVICVALLPEARLTLPRLRRTARA